jgi:CubicO group peptidase (beta-lactamase class C family)
VSKRRFIAAGIVLGAVASGAVPARAAPAQARQLDAVFAALGPNGPGAAVGIYRRGRLVYARGYGGADLDHSVPVTARTVFNVASLTKQFTAFSIALLARDGKLSLDADVQTYLPEFSFGAPLTVSDLVHHMSGVRDYLVLAGLAGRGDADLLTQAQALALVRRQRALGFAPGTRFDYSNSNYVLLAEIVKRVSGKSLREFMRERIFAPLGMTATRLHDDLGLIEPGSATGYRPREGGGWARAVYNHETVGAGNLLSTVGDLAYELTDEAERDRMPRHLLKLAAIELA